VAGGVAGRLGGPYGAAQTILLFAYAAAWFLSTAPRGRFALAGDLLCLAGLGLIAAAFVSLGSAVQVDPEPRAGAVLVTRGVYARLRHPMYTAIVVLVIGIFLKKPVLPMGALTAAIIAFLALKVRVEERLLAERYPDYAAYRARTWGVFLTPPR
jgi:protein-S-isoprenylcysteine O-methyltransferase Ste14